MADRATSGGAARNRGIDLGRILLCLPVALLHAMPPPNVPGTPSWAVLVATGCRCAVPFYFVANGFGLTPAAGKLIRQAGRRLLAYAAWLAFYLVFERLMFGHQPALSVRGLVTGGGADHLWFLPASAVAVLAVGAGFALAGPVATFIAALSLAGIGICFGSYHAVLGVAALPAQRVAMAPVLIVAGWWIRQRAPVMPVAAALAMSLLAWLAILAEDAGISAVTRTPLVSHDLVAATLLFGVAAFLLFRGLDGVIPRGGMIERLAGLGRLSLGVYALHLVFVWAWRMALPDRGPATTLLVAMLAVATAALAAVAIDRLPVLRKLVG